MLGTRKLHLALIGKNIKHSLSKSVYENLLGFEIQYDLLDFEDEKDLPKLSDLKHYDGISITSPYKKHYLAECQVDEKVRELGAINCLKGRDGKFFATNTDYLALDEILNKMDKELRQKEIMIFGDGPMSTIVQKLLEKRGMSFQVFSRKLGNFEETNNQARNPSVLINCLSRQVLIPYQFRDNDILFDLNYKNFEIIQNITSRITYIDGLELLELQANFALSFWNIKDC